MRIESALASAIAATAPLNFAGTWRNELNSEMKLTQRGSSLTGTYTSIVNNGGKPSAEGKLIGWVSGRIIAFSVNYVDFDSISSWVGQYVDRNASIETLWYLDQTVAVGSEWDSINAGSDTFWRA